MTYLLWAIVIYLAIGLAFMFWFHTGDITLAFKWPLLALFGLFGNVQ